MFNMHALQYLQYFWQICEIRLKQNFNRIQLHYFQINFIFMIPHRQWMWLASFNPFCFIQSMLKKSVSEITCDDSCIAHFIIKFLYPDVMIICSNFQLYHYNVIDNNNIIYRKSVKMAKINDLVINKLFLLMTVFSFSCPVFYINWMGTVWKLLVSKTFFQKNVTKSHM